MPPETVAYLLQEGRWLLEQAEIGPAMLDARLLLQHATTLSHEDLIAEPRRMLDDQAIARYRALLESRVAHEPVSRIIGLREFYGRDFAVTPAVLDPRPDTETLVEAALAMLPPDATSTVLDLGTGSGAIIVTLLAERPRIAGVASDLSPATLAVARENALRHGVEARLSLIESSWFAEIAGTYDLIVSNPPYIPHRAIDDLPPEVRAFDPVYALDGGPDGCEAYRRIAAGAGHHLAPGGRIVVEIGNDQAALVETIFETHGFAALGRWEDLGGRTRCVGFANLAVRRDKKGVGNRAKLSYL